MTYKVFACEDIAFDEAYCKNMKLPFKHGWDHWEIYERTGPKTLRQVAAFDHYAGVEAFLG